MKHRIKYIAICGAVMMTTACNTDETAGVEQFVGDAVSFTVSTANGTVTRAFSTLDNYWTMNDEMAICEESTVCCYKASETSTGSGSRVHVEPVTSAYGSAFFWSPLVTSRTFSAWYPYSGTEPATVTGATDQRSNTTFQTGNQGTMTNDEYNQLDLLYAPDVTAGYKESVDLVFYHQMCRIIVTVNSTETKGAKPVTSITFGKDNVAAGGNLTPGYTGATRAATASWSGVTQNTSVQMRLSNFIVSENPTIRQYTYECIVPPQSLAASAVVFQITTTDSNEKSTTTEYIPSNVYQDAPDFQAGYQYNFMLTLSRAGVVNISTLQVNDWATESVNGLTATIPDAGY